MSGIFIVIGGIDGCGSTTHCKLIYDWIKENYRYGVVLTKEPSEGKIGKLLREYLKDDSSDIKTDALLFAADRAEHVEKTILPALNKGMVVISDRYIESSIAYQVSQGLKLKWILKLNQYFIQPNLTIILDLPAEDALKRKQNKEDKFENLVFLKKVRKIYLKYARKFNYKIINSDRNIETVQDKIREIIKEIL